MRHDRNKLRKTGVELQIAAGPLPRGFDYLLLDIEAGYGICFHTLKFPTLQAMAHSEEVGSGHCQHRIRHFTNLGDEPRVLPVVSLVRTEHGHEHESGRPTSGGSFSGTGVSAPPIANPTMRSFTVALTRGASPVGRCVAAIFLVPRNAPFRDHQHFLMGHVCPM